MKQIYISHSRDDETAARALSGALETSGHTVWRHKRTHLSGHPLATAKNHLAEADDVIAIWSKTSINNPDVCDAATVGHATGRLTSVLADYVQPPFGLGVATAVDITDWKGGSADATAHRLKGLFPAVRAAPASEPISASEPAPRPPRKQRRNTLPLWPFALTAVTCLAAIGVVVG